MSDTKRFSGKFKPTGYTLEEFMNKSRDTIEQQYILDQIDDDPLEAFHCYFDSPEWNGQYFVLDTIVYETITCEEIDSDYMSNVHDNGDGTFSFNIAYYNGGCGFEECMWDGFSKLKQLNWLKGTGFGKE